MTILWLWLLLAAEPAAPSPNETPIAYTANPAFYNQTLAVLPPAPDCRYWGAAQLKDKCVGYFVFNSNTHNLRCHVDAKFTSTVVCEWKAPKKKEAETR